MNLFEELLETQLKRLFFAALIELAEEVAAGAECGVAESEGCIAEVLERALLGLPSEGGQLE